jgi:probable non-F420 flavinoid oxidoreductase
VTLIGYHASHEQFTPADMLRLAIAAETAGFDAAMCSDHIAPWSEAQGESGYAWSWLGAALQATSLSFGTVSVPGYRYHPAITAQAIATLEQMYPGRFWVALGSGEAMNEQMTGVAWPLKAERNARLLECVDVIRRLLAGETVTHHGRIVLEDAKVWSLPSTPPPLIGAALSPETAATCGEWADGLATVAPAAQLAEIIEAFRANGGQGKPVYVQVHLSWAETDEVAMTNAMDQWRAACLPAPLGQDLRTPAHLDAAAQYLREDDVAKAVQVSADPAVHIARLRECLSLGVDRLYLHNVGRNQEAFIDHFGRHVLPALR